jgi:hypothetical protein
MAYPTWDKQTMRKRNWRRLLALSGLAAGPRAITNVGELISHIGGGGKGRGGRST